VSTFIVCLEEGEREERGREKKGGEETTLVPVCCAPTG
jgi:hypothetical protein